VLRIGPVIFVVMPPDRPRAIKNKIEQLKTGLGSAYADNSGNIFFVMPSAFIKGQISSYISIYTVSMIAKMLSDREKFKETVVTCLGAGDGIHAQVALGLGAREVVLVEKDKVRAQQASQLLNSKGWRKKTKDSGQFTIINADMADRNFARIIFKHGVADISNIVIIHLGPWYGNIHEIAINMVNKWPNVWFILNVGFWHEKHDMDFDKIKGLLEKAGFVTAKYIDPYGISQILIAAHSKADIQTSGADDRSIRQELERNAAVGMSI